MTPSDSQFGFKPGDLFIIISAIKRYPQISSALIFGSRAMGNYKKGSDIDIALKGTHLENIIHHLLGFLNDESPLPYKFDIIDYQTDNLELKKHIDQHGIEILFHN